MYHQGEGWGHRNTTVVDSGLKRFIAIWKVMTLYFGAGMCRTQERKKNASGNGLIRQLCLMYTLLHARK